MRLSRLRGRKVNDALLRKGRVWKGTHMTIRWLPSAPRHPSVDPSKPGVYVGVLASAKLDKSAVRRNRMRRRCREALRVTLLPYAIAPSEGEGAMHTSRPWIARALQLLIAPRSSSLNAPFDEILGDVARFLSQLPHA